MLMPLQYDLVYDRQLFCISQHFATVVFEITFENDFLYVFFIEHLSVIPLSLLSWHV